jgi:hypothetical protein
MPRLAGIKLYLFPDRSLLMRIMAVKTHFVFIEILDLLGTVFSFLKLRHDLFMADQAVVRFKEIPSPFPYGFRVRMKRLLLSVVVAVPAGGLTVNRSMEFLGVDPPGGMGRAAQPQQKRDKKSD